MIGDDYKLHATCKHFNWNKLNMELALNTNWCELKKEWVVPHHKGCEDYEEENE